MRLKIRSFFFSKPHLFVWFVFVLSLSPVWADAFVEQLIKADQIKNTDFQTLKKEAQLKFIKDSLTKDLSLNNYFKGLISGLFTKDEFIFYLDHKQSINKRIIQIIEKRIVDSITELKK